MELRPTRRAGRETLAEERNAARLALSTAKGILKQAVASQEEEVAARGAEK